MALVALLLASTIFASSFSEGAWNDHRTKSQSSITLTLASASVQVGSSMHANGVLKGTTGIAGATVNLKVTLPDGTVAYPTQGASTVTNSAGNFAMDYVPTKAGTYTFTATFAGNYKYTASSTVQSFTASAPAESTPLPIRWTWMQSPASGVVSQSNVYTIKMEIPSADGTWSGADNTRFDFAFTNPSGVASILSYTTPAGSGTGSVSFTPNVAGNWTVKCDWDHNNHIYAWDSSPVKSISVVSSPPPAPTKQSTSITLSGATSVQAGSAMHATGVLSGASPIAGATLSLQVILPDGSVSYPTQGQSTTTDSTGKFAMDYTPKTAGTYKYTATYAGSSTNLGSSIDATFTATTPVQPPVSTGYNYIVAGNTVKTASGAVVYTGSDATSTLQWAINSCPAGGKVFIEAGTYVITTSTLIKPNSASLTYRIGLSIHNKAITLQGAGTGQTILKMAANQHMLGGYGAILLTADGFDGLVIDGITFDGNRAQNTASNWEYDGAGLIWTYGYQHNMVMSHLEVRNSFAGGIYLGNKWSADSGPSPPYNTGWNIDGKVLNCVFHDNRGCALMHDACERALFENISFTNDATEGRRALWLEGNTDYLSRPNNLVVKNATFVNSDLRIWSVKGVTMSGISFSNAGLVESGATVYIYQSADVTLNLVNLVRDTSAGVGYGVAVGPSATNIKVNLAGTIVAKIGVATVNVGDDGASTGIANGDLTFTGGTIKATVRGVYTSGTSKVIVQNVHFDVPSTGYNLYVDGTSKLTVTGSDAARTTLSYVASGATLTKSSNGAYI